MTDIIQRTDAGFWWQNTRYECSKSDNILSYFHKISFENNDIISNKSI